MLNSNDYAERLRILNSAVDALPEEKRDRFIQSQIDVAQATWNREARKIGLTHIDTEQKAEAFVRYFEEHPELDPRFVESYFEASTALDSDGTFRTLDEEAERNAAAEAAEKRKAETPSRADVNREKYGVKIIAGNRTVVHRENNELDDAVLADIAYQRRAREAHGLSPEPALPKEYMARLRHLCIQSRREHAGERTQFDIDQGNRKF